MVFGKFSPKKKPQRAVEPDCEPVGLDIGTSNIAVYKNSDSGLGGKIEPNAFFCVPSLKTTKDFLDRNNIRFLEKNDSLYILGKPAMEFAGMMGQQTRYPMESGMLNLGEDEGINVIESILSSLLGQAQSKDQPLGFSVPGKPIDSNTTAMFNESIFKSLLENLGYRPRPINEAMAVLVSEFPDGHVTGIGISMGGGMCNVCCSYLSIPVVTYSIQKGGNFIDQTVAGSVGESPAIIRIIKEQNLDLASAPKNSIEHGLHACYDNLFTTLAKSLEEILGASDNVPKLRKAVPIVLSGGAVLAPGSREKFASILQDVTLPFEISEIILAESPLYATAKGAYLIAKEQMNSK
ncbi:MAG: hypothetical protein JRJ04_10250 [Deltaproteobacteria bacterium]|nr:hypothetical protein [Deltaproteobacteria bacterium]